MIRTALLSLLAGFAAGAILLAAAGLSEPPPVGWLRPVHVELVTIGFLVNLGLGVAYWILPRLPDGGQRGPEAPVRAAFVLLNAGVWTAALAGALAAPAPVAALGRGAELLAAGLFARHAWPRVRAGVLSSTSR